MIGADYRNDLNVVLSVSQLRTILTLYEEAAEKVDDGPGEEVLQTVTIFPTSAGLAALEDAVIVKITAWNTTGYKSEFTEALIDKQGAVRVGYEGSG